MNRQRRLAPWLGAILGTLCALLFAAQSQASDIRRYTEEFHQTYPLAAGGRVELDNLNGAVHITAWDQNVVKVDAVKYAGTKERLDETQIEVEAGSDFVSIRTKYPHHDHTFSGGWTRSCRGGVHFDRPSRGTPRRNQTDQRAVGYSRRHRRGAGLLHQRTIDGGGSAGPGQT